MIMKKTIAILSIITGLLLGGGSFLYAKKVIDQDLLKQQMESSIWYFVVAQDGNTVFVKCRTGGSFTCLLPIG